MGSTSSSTRNPNENEAKVNVDGSDGEDRKNFEKEIIIPGLIENIPKTRLQIEYENDIKVSFGNYLRPLQTSVKPKIKWEGDPQKLYCLVMIDPDVPSRGLQFLGEFLHYLIANIPGNDIEKGEEIASYRGPAPPLGTGKHRYIFLLYEQPNGTLAYAGNPLTSQMARLKFKTSDFVKKYGLSGPIAVNFFYSRH